MRLTIDGILYDDVDVQGNIGGSGRLLILGEMEFYVFENSDEAGEDAVEYWKDMVENDPGEFTCIVGEENLIKWCLGQWAGCGTVQVRSLNEWLELWRDTPEDQWANYDGKEVHVSDCNEELIEALGFTPTVAYRSN